MTNSITQVSPRVHIRFDGRSIDLHQSDLDVGPMSTDEVIRNRVAEHLGVPPVKLQAFAVDRNPTTQDITVRPEAVFG